MRQEKWDQFEKWLFESKIATLTHHLEYHKTLNQELELKLDQMSSLYHNLVNKIKGLHQENCLEVVEFITDRMPLEEQSQNEVKIAEKENMDQFKPNIDQNSP